MKSFLLVVLGIVIGGVGAGAGVVTGLHSGACLTLEAAREKGLITADQETEIWIAAVEQLTGEGLPESVTKDPGEVDCARVVADLKASMAK